MSRLLPAVAAVLIAVTGCGRSVAVEPLAIDDASTAAACGALIADLPQQLSAGRAWTVEPDPRSTAAWGSPPVVLRCGDDVPTPAATDQLLVVDGVTWLVRTLTGGEEFTTVGLAPGVMVIVPSQYTPTAAVLTELGPSVAKHTDASA